MSAKQPRVLLVLSLASFVVTIDARRLQPAVNN